MKNNSIFLVVFLIASAIQLVGAVIEMPLMQDLSKPVIMISLMGYYWMEAEKRSGIFILALLFCWAGDVLLIFQPQAEWFFIFGLVAFLVGHLFYMISYSKFMTTDKTNELLWTQKIRYSLPLILIGTGLITILFPKLGALKIPVLIYSMVLVGMTMTALFRYGRTTSQSFWMVFLGAVLFMVSDSLLAINKFYSPLPMAGFLIMFTYISAQYFIVAGVLRHK
ncbi:MAG: lysoplasmalogenase [Cyclobacteriaceae bacterium]|nr:lysoplasmalogenase [Cyclobacteriaceae bacterium]